MTPPTPPKAALDLVDRLLADLNTVFKISDQHRRARWAEIVQEAMPPASEPPKCGEPSAVAKEVEREIVAQFDGRMLCRPGDIACRVTALVSAETARLREYLDEARREFGVVSRACDNWREFPGQAETDHDHPDWKAAARAMIEREQLQKQIAALKASRKACEAYYSADDECDDMERLVMTMNAADDRCRKLGIDLEN